MNTLRDAKRRPTHPGAILREDVLPELKISPAAFAEHIGISVQSLQELLLEQRPLTADVAQQLAVYLKTSPESWLRMQHAVDNWVTA
jgi:addiction module HigA family antidote